MIVNLSIPSSKTTIMGKKCDRKDILQLKEMKSKGEEKQLGEFISSKVTLIEMLNEVLLAEGK